MNNNNNTNDTTTTVHEYVSNQKRLLELELQSQEEEEVGPKKNNSNSTSTSSSSSSSSTSTSKKNNGDADKQNEEGRISRIIRNVQVQELSIGLMGRTVVTLVPSKGEISTSNYEKDGQSKKNKEVIMMPSHRITVGDEVEIMSKVSSSSVNNEQKHTAMNSAPFSKRKRRTGGVVSAVTDTSISIALYGNHHNHTSTSKQNKNTDRADCDDDDDDDDDETQILGSPPLVIVPKSSVAVHKKMISILNKLKEHGENHDNAGSVIRSIFNPTSNNLNKTINHDHHAIGDVGNNNNPPREFTPFNPNLDESQIEAIQFCLKDQPLSLIHGPPGTGKFYRHQLLCDFFYILLHLFFDSLFQL